MSAGCASTASASKPDGGLVRGSSPAECARAKQRTAPARLLHSITWLTRLRAQSAEQSGSRECNACSECLQRLNRRLSRHRSCSASATREVRCAAIPG
jgi:hypothetical protein